MPFWHFLRHHFVKSAKTALFTTRGDDRVKKKLPVIIYPIVILADRPERCALNSTLSYTGSSTRRWVYASSIDPQKIASCHSCFTSRLKLYLNETSSHQRRTPQCNRCCDFNYHRKSTTIVYKPPSHYPKTKHLQSPPFPKDREIGRAHV